MVGTESIGIFTPSIGYVDFRCLLYVRNKVCIKIRGFGLEIGLNRGFGLEIGLNNSSSGE